MRGLSRVSGRVGGARAAKRFESPVLSTRSDAQGFSSLGKLPVEGGFEVPT